MDWRPTPPAAGWKRAALDVPAGFAIAKLGSAEQSFAMHRKDFVQTTGLTALALPALANLGCSTDADTSTRAVRPFELDELIPPTLIE